MIKLRKNMILSLPPRPGIAGTWPHSQTFNVSAKVYTQVLLLAHKHFTNRAKFAAQPPSCPFKDTLPRTRSDFAATWVTAEAVPLHRPYTVELGCLKLR